MPQWDLANKAFAFTLAVHALHHHQNMPEIRKLQPLICALQPSLTASLREFVVAVWLVGWGWEGWGNALLYGVQR